MSELSKVFQELCDAIGRTRYRSECKSIAYQGTDGGYPRQVVIHALSELTKFEPSFWYEDPFVRFNWLSVSMREAIARIVRERIVATDKKDELLEYSHHLRYTLRIMAALPANDPLARDLFNVYPYERRMELSPCAVGGCYEPLMELLRSDVDDGWKSEADTAVRVALNSMRWTKDRRPLDDIRAAHDAYARTVLFGMKARDACPPRSTLFTTQLAFLLALPAEVCDPALLPGLHVYPAITDKTVMRTFAEHYLRKESSLLSSTERAHTLEILWLIQCDFVNDRELCEGIRRRREEIDRMDASEKDEGPKKPIPDTIAFTVATTHELLRNWTT